MKGKTRAYLFRVLVAMVYLQRTGDARTYWLLLPRRLKFGRTAMQCFIRSQSAHNISSMFERFNHCHDLIKRVNGPAFDLTAAVFQIPFKVYKQFNVTSDK